MNRGWDSGSGKRLAWWMLGILVVTTCLSIGLPLVGSRVFFGTDMLQDYPPWNQEMAPGEGPINPFFRDPVDALMPLRTESRRRIWDGDLPLSTPFPSGGIALGTVPDAGLLSPLNLPYLVLPLWYAPAVTKLLEMATAAGFTFLFLRLIGLGRPASLIGALVYMNSGFLVVWTNWPQSQVGALIPALFWAVERGVHRDGVWAVLPVTVVTAVMLFGGFPVVTFYALLASGIYVLARLFALREWTMQARLRRLALFAGAILLALGITAVQLFPFVDRLRGTDVAYREQTADTHLPPRALVTLGIPNAFGSPVDRNYFGALHIRRAGYGPATYHEINGFVGATALVLITVAATQLVRRRRGTGGTARGVRPFLWLGSGVAGVLLYVGGPLLALLQLTPVFRLNYIGRFRSILCFFLACLAATGLQALERREAERGAPGERLLVALVWVAAGTIAFVGLWSMWRLAGEAQQRQYVLRESMIPLIAAGLTVGALLLRGRTGRAGHLALMWGVPLAIAIESLAFAIPYWPRTPKALFYPVTPAHQFLQSRLGSERLASAGIEVFPGTATFYGLRSVTAHAFQQPVWLEALTAANRRSVGRATRSRLRPRAEVATSPVLDRLSVRYFVTAPEAPVFGRKLEGAPPVGRIVLRPGSSLVQQIPAERIRAVVVGVVSWAQGSTRDAVLAAEVLDASGDVLTSGARRLLPRGRKSEFSIPVVELDAAPPDGGAQSLRVRLTLRAKDGHVVLAADGSGGPAMSVVVGGDDRLRLVFAEGATIYERSDALPRVRWAPRAEVMRDASERLALLAAGVPPDTVVLSEEGPVGSGRGAEIRVLEDGGDAVRVDVLAQGQGYLVIADAMQDGWTARVDGERVPLRPADHAGV
ncbi:MAG: YfhO family protein, partial [Actinomycetota bacterium]